MTHIAYSDHSGLGSELAHLVGRALAWTGISHLMRHLGPFGLVLAVIAGLVLIAFARTRRRSFPAPRVARFRHFRRPER